MSGLVAVLLASGAAALAVGGRPGLLVARLGPMRRGAAGGGRASRLLATLANQFSTDDRGRIVVGALAGALGGLAVAGPVAGLLAAGSIAVFVRLRRAAASARDRRRRQSEVAEACIVLASTLRTGVPARQALDAVADDWPGLFGPAARRAAIGGDVPVALREASTNPGCGALAGVAAGWEVSERTGAALSDVLVAVADTLRAEAAVHREAEAQLATVRATSRLLALLPVGTLLLLSGGRGAAVEFLVGSPLGMTCVVVAATLVGAGMWWIHRLARSAVRSPWER
ncbi:MAG TPA: type II secretion system F family protein [Jiangellaceae bacterium]|nr:type II secretion system F family protein [Jiangellaceae bacterium]